MSRASFLLAALISTISCGSSAPTGTGGAGGSTSSTTTGTGGAEAGPTTFPCKGITCHYGFEACTVTNVPGQADTGTCTPLPVACTIEGAQCDCFGDLGPECTCLKQPTGEFSVFCTPM